jgi:hypothetical protein
VGWLTVFIMDWEWIEGFPTPEARTDAFSRDDSEAHREDQRAINGEDLNDRELTEILCALEDLSKQVDKRTGDLIATAFSPLWRGRDELELTDQFTSISPATIARMAEALDALDLWDVARQLAAEDGEEYVAEDHAFLEQVARIIRRGRERGWGLFTHYG